MTALVLQIARRWLWLTLLWACASAPAQPSVAHVRQVSRLPSSAGAQATVLRVQAWPAASARFRSQGPWLGADSAYSISLDAERVLWLFGDTFLDPLADGTRENGPNFFVRNSVAIQSGVDARSAHDLAHSELSFAWGPNRDGAPSSFFQDIDTAERFIWPLHGARLPDGKLLLFRMQVVPSQGGLGFRVDAWDAVAIDDPTQAPALWQPRRVASATRRFAKLVGASVLLDAEYLYAYAVDNIDTRHAVFLARWPVPALIGLAEAALDDPEWFTAQGFVAQHSLASPEALLPLFNDGQTEFSVHYDAARRRFIEIQMQGLFVADEHTQVALRTATRPEGPWSVLTPIYRPAEHTLPNATNLAAYAAKAHPAQLGADLVLTYTVNDLKRFPPSDAVYYPQVLAVSFGAAAQSGRPQVSAQ